MISYVIQEHWAIDDPQVDIWDSLAKGYCERVQMRIRTANTWEFRDA